MQALANRYEASANPHVQQVHRTPMHTEKIVVLIMLRNTMDVGIEIAAASAIYYLYLIFMMNLFWGSK